MIMIADIRPELRKELYNNIGRIINSSDKDSLLPVTKLYPGFYHTTIVRDIREGKSETHYFLVVVAKWVLKNLHTYIIISNEKPKTMMDTMVFEIDQRKGDSKMLECLPKDIPFPEGIEVKPHSEIVFEGGKEMPLIN